MRENGLDKLPGHLIPVYQNKMKLGHVSYQELMDFLGQELNGRNVYMHKHLFDLKSALIVIKSMRRKENKRNEYIMTLFAVLVVIGVGLWAFAQYHRGGADSYRRFAGKFSSWGADGGLKRDQPQSPARTVRTPKGKLYHIRLPDGSEVWLNSASEISYPARFKGGQRVVFLKGEAYFEVLKVCSGGRHDSIRRADSKKILMPFVVKTKQQTVEALGTSFNVNAYADEDCVRTMLLEGSVRVTPVGRESRSVVLKPNQQSILTETHIDVEEADPEMGLAWREGEYWFRKEPLENVMRVLSRWHDVEVVYEDVLTAKQKMGGSISRSWELSKALNMLELSGVAVFRLQGNKIIVSAELSN